jgi:hypothetical protein
LKVEFDLRDSLVAGDLIDLFGFDNHNGVKVGVYDILISVILYSPGISIDEKLSLLLIMYDFSRTEKISLSEVMLLLKSTLSVVLKIEKINESVNVNELENFVENVCFRSFIKSIFEKRKSERQA